MARPERTCVGCRARARKDELLRLVAHGEQLVLDRKVTEPGRGAYVHPDPSCIQAAFERGGLAHGLRTRLAEPEAARLRAEMERNGHA